MSVYVMPRYKKGKSKSYDTITVSFPKRMHDINFKATNPATVEPEGPIAPHRLSLPKAPQPKPPRPGTRIGRGHIRI